MLGFGDFSKLQMLGSRIGSGPPSLFNVFLMGTGAGLVASPCTGPILAALLAWTAKNQDITESATLLLTYSFGFALPYVFLGASAAKVSRVKVHYRVQIAVKLIFASVMFALGLYYLRIPAYEFLQELKPWWKTIAFWSCLTGTILLATWIALPRLHNNKLSNVFPGLILALGIFATSQALTTGPVSSLKWYKVEEEAWAAAKAAGKPILVDAWAEWCEACKKMDVTTFVDPEVVAVLEKDWILLKLDLTESNDVNDALQEKYGLQSLPTLTLLPPDANLEQKVHITGYASAGTLLTRLREWQAQRGNSP